MTEIVAVIPARGGSKVFPEKVALRTFGSACWRTEIHVFETGSISCHRHAVIQQYTAENCRLGRALLVRIIDAVNPGNGQLGLARYANLRDATSRRDRLD